MEISKVVIAGCGVLGSQIALQTSFCDFDVTVILRNEASVERGKVKLSGVKQQYLKTIEDMQSGGDCAEGITSEKKLTKEQIEELKQKVEKAFELVKFTTDYEEYKNADLVIESISENPTIKKDFYETISKLLKKDSIIVSNTSTLLPSMLSKFTDRPQNFLCMHFANTIWKSNIAEIMAHPGTDKSCITTVESFAKKIKMHPSIILKENPGYVLTNLVSSLLNSSLQLWAEDFAQPKEIDCVWKTGTKCPQGPFEMMDVIEVPSLYNVTCLRPDSKVEGSTRYKTKMKLKQMMDEGKWGVSTGEGFYKYK